MNAIKNNITIYHRSGFITLLISVWVLIFSIVNCSPKKHFSESASQSFAGGPVQVHPDNPHYFMYKEKPIVLVTSDHHYGAVINLDFDYVKFLNFLADQGMNYTRIYPGGMFEPPDKYMTGNPLGPLAGRQILPWAKSTRTGANSQLAGEGEPSFKFDLEQWNPAYFERLEAFVELARERDIVVEVAFFNGMYYACWPLMPWYHDNNIQNVGNYEADECGLYTTADPRNSGVIKYQKAYIAKITKELNHFDNLIYDICDEPSLVGLEDGNIIIMPDSLVTPWLLEMKDAFLAAEAKLPRKHLLGQTIQNLSPDLSGEPWCDWMPTEYISPAERAFEQNYDLNKPLVNVESDFFGIGLVKQPYTVDQVRIESWWFIVGGGAGHINLNGEYRRGRETGGSDTQTRIAPQQKILVEFMSHFDFVRMTRTTAIGDLPPGAVVSAIAEPGKQYAVYLFHGYKEGEWGAHFVDEPGAWQDSFTLPAVPAGQYIMEWTDPVTGNVISVNETNWSGGDFKLTTPEYPLDIALRMVLKQQ